MARGLNEGIARLRDASFRNANSPEIQYHLAVALHKSGKNAQAKQHLTKALESNKQFTEKNDAQLLFELLSR